MICCSKSKKGTNEEMLGSKEVLEMEQKLQNALSIGFFEHGSHSDMDLEIYPAYHAIQRLQILLEAYEEELRELAEELIEEVKPDDHTH